MGVVNPDNKEDPKVQELAKNGLAAFPIPAEVLAVQAAGIDWYDIQFISPAARIMSNEELASTLKFLAVIGEAGAISQDFVDVIDPDGTAEKLKALTATDSIVTRSMQARKEIRESRAKMQMEMARVEADAKMAAAEQARGQAAAARSGAVRNLSEIGV